jgi:hypothetical protein
MAAGGAGSNCGQREAKELFLPGCERNARLHAGFPQRCRSITCNMRQISFNSSEQRFQHMLKQAEDVNLKARKSLMRVRDRYDLKTQNHSDSRVLYQVGDGANGFERQTAKQVLIFVESVVIFKAASILLLAPRQVRIRRLLYCRHFNMSPYQSKMCLSCIPYVETLGR